MHGHHSQCPCAAPHDDQQARISTPTGDAQRLSASNRLRHCIIQCVVVLIGQITAGVDSVQPLAAGVDQG